MAPAQKKATLCCSPSAHSHPPGVVEAEAGDVPPPPLSLRREAASASAEVALPLSADWDVNSDQLKRNVAAAPIPAVKGVQLMRAETKHPLDPLSAAEIAVAVGTVRAAGATPEMRDGMRFIEVVLKEPDKHIVALADAYFFPPFQPSLLPKTKGGPVIPRQLPPRQARIVVYNKRLNETSVWVAELSEVHAAARGGHHRGKVISSKVVENVQPPMLVEDKFGVCK